MARNLKEVRGGIELKSNLIFNLIFLFYNNLLLINFIIKL